MMSVVTSLSRISGNNSDFIFHHFVLTNTNLTGCSSRLVKNPPLSSAENPPACDFLKLFYSRRSWSKGLYWLVDSYFEHIEEPPNKERIRELREEFITWVKSKLGN